MTRKPMTESEAAQDAEANAFAMELLMPKTMLLADVEEACTLMGVRHLSLMSDAQAVIKKLAVKYEVDTEHMTIRLAGLGCFK